MHQCTRPELNGSDGSNQYAVARVWCGMTLVHWRVREESNRAKQAILWIEEEEVVDAIQTRSHFS